MSHPLADRVRQAAERDRDFEAKFNRGRNVVVRHFYSLGDMGRGNVEFFAVGFFDAEGAYTFGVYETEDGRGFCQVNVETVRSL